MVSKENQRVSKASFGFSFGESGEDLIVMVRETFSAWCLANAFGNCLEVFFHLKCFYGLVFFSFRFFSSRFRYNVLWDKIDTGQMVTTVRELSNQVLLPEMPIQLLEKNVHFSFLFFRTFVKHIFV